MELIKTKQKDPVIQANQYFGSIIIIISGLILYTDKFLVYLGYDLGGNFSYYETLDVFVWYLCQTISPLLIAFGSFFKPWKWSFLSPVVSFSIQLFFVLSDEHYLHKDLVIHYSIAFVVFFFVFAYLITRVIFLYAGKIKKLKYFIRMLVDFIVITIKRKYVPSDRKREYIIDYMEILKKLNR